MTIKYAIYNAEDGYMHDDGDSVYGYGYDHEIDEYTVLFDRMKSAAIYCSGKDIVVEIEVTAIDDSSSD